MINAGIYVLEPSFLDAGTGRDGVPQSNGKFSRRWPRRARFTPSVQMRSGPTWAPRRKYLEANLAWAGREGAVLVGGGPGAHPMRTSSTASCITTSRIEKGATVRDAVVLEGGRVRRRRVCEPLGPRPQRGCGPGAVVDALSVLGDGWVVAAGDVLKGARLPAPELKLAAPPQSGYQRCSIGLSAVNGQARPAIRWTTSPVHPVWWEAPEAGAGVPVEVLVEPYEVSPGGVLLEESVVAVDGPVASGPVRTVR